MKILTRAVMIAKEIPTSKDEIFLMADKNETFKLVALLTKHIKINLIIFFRIDIILNIV